LKPGSPGGDFALIPLERSLFKLRLHPGLFLVSRRQRLGPRAGQAAVQTRINLRQFQPTNQPTTLRCGRDLVHRAWQYLESVLAACSTNRSDD
jgi:hypothetical protein